VCAAFWRAATKTEGIAFRRAPGSGRTAADPGLYAQDGRWDGGRRRAGPRCARYGRANCSRGLSGGGARRGVGRGGLRRDAAGRAHRAVSAGGTGVVNGSDRPRGRVRADRRSDADRLAAVGERRHGLPGPDRARIHAVGQSVVCQHGQCEPQHKQRADHCASRPGRCGGWGHRALLSLIGAVGRIWSPGVRLSVRPAAWSLLRLPVSRVSCSSRSCVRVAAVLAAAFRHASRSTLRRAARVRHGQSVHIFGEHYGTATCVRPEIAGGMAGRALIHSGGVGLVTRTVAGAGSWGERRWVRNRRW